MSAVFLPSPTVMAQSDAGQDKPAGSTDAVNLVPVGQVLPRLFETERGVEWFFGRVVGYGTAQEAHEPTVLVAYDDGDSEELSLTAALGAQRVHAVNSCCPACARTDFALPPRKKWVSSRATSSALSIMVRGRTAGALHDYRVGNHFRAPEEFIASSSALAAGPEKVGAPSRDASNEGGEGAPDAAAAASDEMPSPSGKGEKRDPPPDLEAPPPGKRRAGAGPAEAECSGAASPAPQQQPPQPQPHQQRQPQPQPQAPTHARDHQQRQQRSALASGLSPELRQSLASLRDQPGRSPAGLAAADDAFVGEMSGEDARRLAKQLLAEKVEWMQEREMLLPARIDRQHLRRGVGAAAAPSAAPRQPPPRAPVVARAPRPAAPPPTAGGRGAGGRAPAPPAAGAGPPLSPAAALAAAMARVAQGARALQQASAELQGESLRPHGAPAPAAAAAGVFGPFGRRAAPPPPAVPGGGRPALAAPCQAAAAASAGAAPRTAVQADAAGRGAAAVEGVWLGALGGTAAADQSPAGAGISGWIKEEALPAASRGEVEQAAGSRLPSSDELASLIAQAAAAAATT